MKQIVWLGCVIAIFAGSGAALSFGQSASQDPQNREAMGTGATYYAPGAPVEEVRQPPASSVEDAPVDMPQDTHSEWNPEASQIESPVTETPVVKPKPRKALRDVAGTAADELWADDQTAEEAAVIAENQRRARPVDPTKKGDLSSLARVLGSLHALRVSCSGREDQTYRSRMSTLLDLEAAEGSPLRDPLVDAFNAGFQAYGQGSATCPADRANQEAKLAKAGFRLSKKMAGLYRPVEADPAALENQSKQPAAK